MVLVGPSGSGKTTALRMVAGLEEISSGTLSMGGKVVNDLPPKDRNVAMVFQSYALYPHMTVAENIGFSLKLRKVPKAEVNAKVKEAASLLGLSDYLGPKPAQLSGGQRQRVAMGRAIVREPSVFLMDEPLSNLDAKMRVQMRAEISRIQRRVGVATFYVTHDQTEAMTLGDRVAVLHKGAPAAGRHPRRALRAPRQHIRGRLHRLAGHEPVRGHHVAHRRRGEGRPPDAVPARAPRPPAPACAAYRDRKLTIGVRPENLADAALEPAAPPGTTLVADVELVEALGNELQVHFLIDATTARSEDTEAATGTAELGGLANLRPGRPGPKAWPAYRPAPTAGRRPGHLRRRHHHLHFFDPDSGPAIWG